MRCIVAALGVTFAVACSSSGSAGSDVSDAGERSDSGPRPRPEPDASGVGTGGTNGIGGAGAAPSTLTGGASAGGAGAGGAGTGGSTVVGEGDLGPADFADGELDPASSGATITFQDVGTAGWYPSRRDPASGDCDVRNEGSCCMTEHTLASDLLTPWNEELGMTLRGPMLVKQIAVYESSSTSDWSRVSAWDSRGTSEGIVFWGSGAEGGFDGRIGNVCEAEVAPDRPFPCGADSVPFCPEGEDKYFGWNGSKLIVVLATNPHHGSSDLDDLACDGPGHGWHDAPWIGLSHGELVRSGRYSGCHCWSKPGNPYAQDGCGQFNVFEVVNDNNDYGNLDLFSTNLVSYAGYIGEGPCGSQCDASPLPPEADLLDKTTGNTAATAGAVASPDTGPRAAFVRPDTGYRYFVTLLDVQTRTVQIALIHPRAIPPSLDGVLPNLPNRIDRATVDAVLGLRLPL